MTVIHLHLVVVATAAVCVTLVLGQDNLHGREQELEVIGDWNYNNEESVDRYDNDEEHHDHDDHDEDHHESTNLAELFKGKKCKTKKKCKKLGGTCTHKDACDGTIEDVIKGCSKNCVCCVPNMCENTGKCNEKGAYCETSGINCKDGYEGAVGECSGANVPEPNDDCQCCRPPKKCENTGRCNEAGAYCETTGIDCKDGYEGTIGDCSRADDLGRIPLCQCCRPPKPASEQCEELDGFCVKDGDRCDGIFKIIDNPGDDHCCCCAPIPKGSCILMGEIYKSGTVFIENCMRFECEEGKWLTSNELNKRCAMCSIRNDPHFTSFDDLKFDWHGLSTYVLSQKIEKEGCVDCPEIFVASLFDDCGGWATCIHTFYFQPEPGTLIKIEKAVPTSNSQITIDGYTQNLIGALPGELTILKGPAGEEHPAFAWINGACINIMGFMDHGYLLQICGWHANLYAYPTMMDNLCGLCGNYDGDKWNDIMFRDGSTETPPPQPPPWNFVNMQVEPIYGNHWEAPTCIIKEAEAGKAPERKEICADFGEPTPEFIARCKKAIPGQNHLQFINDCAFDQCIATNFGDKRQAEIWLNETTHMIKEIEHQKENTIIYPEDCEHPWVSFGNKQCYLFSEQKMTWDDARSYCQKQIGDLAILDTVSKRKDIISYFNPIITTGPQPSRQDIVNDFNPVITRQNLVSAAKPVAAAIAAVAKPVAAGEAIAAVAGLASETGEALGAPSLSTFWIGAKNWWDGCNDKACDWLWLYGIPVSSGWAPNQPSNTTYMCMYTYPKDQGSGSNILFDHTCTFKNYFICEK